MRHSFLETDWYAANMGETLLLQRPAVLKRGKRLEYLTIAPNAAEGLIATAAGLIADGGYFFTSAYWALPSLFKLDLHGF